MKLIVFLGNPGNEYKKTRHNAGFLFADFLRKKWEIEEWKNEKKFNAELSVFFYFKRKIMLARPQTFMNLSGQSLEKIVSFFNILTENIIIIHDDKDLDFGKIRYKNNSSSGGHRGIESIINHLNTKDFARIKIGVEARENETKINTSDFVLSKFTEIEIETLDQEIFPKVEKKLTEWLELD